MPNKNDQALQHTENEINNLVTTIKVLEQDENVQKYLDILQQYKEFEEALRVQVAEEQITTTYYSVEDKSIVKIAPTIRTTYKPDYLEVKEKFEGRYIVPSVDVKAMKDSPECAKYLDSIKDVKISARKTKVKEKAAPVSLAEESAEDIFA